MTEVTKDIILANIPMMLLDNAKDVLGITFIKIVDYTTNMKFNINDPTNIKDQEVYYWGNRLDIVFIQIENAIIQVGNKKILFYYGQGCYEYPKYEEVFDIYRLLQSLQIQAILSTMMKTLELIST